MMAGLVNVDLGTALEGFGNIVDDLHTSKEEKMELGLKDKQLSVSLLAGQLEINKYEAQHKSIFVSGWRPAVGWICALGMGYEFLVRPLLGWIWKLLQAKAFIPDTLDVPPGLPLESLMTILMGMLGLAGYRTYEKKRGVASNSLVGRGAELVQRATGAKPKKRKFKWPWSK
jgi:hypothetical protein